jgi:UDP-3-O-[3-hydroxymyristoyl] glucosamine N-acyltransferase
MKITVAEIQALKSPYLQFVAGDLQSEAFRPWPPEIAPPGALVYVSDPSQLEAAIEAPAGIIIAAKNCLSKIPDLQKSQALFSTPAISAAMSMLNPVFETKLQRWEEGISPLASIHSSAKIGKGARIGAFVVIGEGAVIDENVVIAPNTVVEKLAKIGKRALLHSFVFIGAECEVGNDCEIHPHVSIGGDGFGFATNPQTGSNHKIPQLGKVIIEDHVEIGSNCTIDRATLTETRIGAGCKLDTHIHIAHNCILGKNGLFASGFAMAGSSRIGDNFKAAGAVLVGDHVTICDNVTVGGNSAVSKDVTAPGAYMGYPLQPWRDGLRTIASLPAITELRREVREIQEKLSTK